MYYDVILPLALKGVLTYTANAELENILQVGMRVVVPIGKKKLLSGIIQNIHSEPQKTDISYKQIICNIDSQPLVTSSQLALWKWISEYYMCSLGEVMKAALPAALKLESETKIVINQEFQATARLGNTQEKILDFLADGKEHSISELTKWLDIKNVMPQLDKLSKLGSIYIGESIKNKYHERTEKTISLTDQYKHNDAGLQIILNSLSRAPKQQQLLTDLLYLLQDKDSISQKQLLEFSNSQLAVLKSLAEKGIIQISDRKISATDNESLIPPHPLNQHQAEAYKEIEYLWQSKQVVLLHGVTGSGKTEVYIHLIQAALERGEQVLYLVPEIALTTQLTNRLRAVFGNRLGIYHSHFSDYERADVYNKMINNEKYDIILGVRSSVFLPFNKLGLIIIDEEHDHSYKQQDPAPRYHARNTAIMLARHYNAKVLLGSATPAVETYYNALQKKFGLVELKQRYGDIQLPQIRCIDTKEHYRRKQMLLHLADPVVEKIQAELRNKKQIIVFQNRRGYSPYIECKQCAYIPKCVNCDVSLTLHKRQGILSCHYCGYTIPIPHHCPACGQETMTEKGIGTERIEDEFTTLFPQANIVRMDQDTTRGKNRFQEIIKSFEEHKADIMVGTQMVSKGLDFQDVSTVVVLNADNLINQPDFRSTEYAYQLLEQVSGRAGRKGNQGVVMIQTTNTQNPLFQFVSSHDYNAFYTSQIAERQEFKYPPFYRLISLTLKGYDYRDLDYAAELLQRNLVQVFSKRVSKVLQPAVSKVQGLYIRHILLKFESHAPYQTAKQMLNTVIENFAVQEKHITISVDIDPM